MSKYTVKELWEKRYKKTEEVYDYAGRLMKKSACGDGNSSYQPTIDHIRPISNGGKDIDGNIEICHRKTNEEKGNSFPNWTANDRHFQAKKVKGKSNEYEIHEIL